MSVTVSAVPILLIGALISSAMGATEQGLRDMRNIRNMKSRHFEVEDLEQLFEQEFQTQIMDKDLLIKTLQEHGATNINQDEENISCDSEKFHLEFTHNQGAPYTLKISANNEYGFEELVEDLGNEYTANAQEVSYNKIKERLEEKNLEIENEEICDDNTIVLTVNLD